MEPKEHVWRALEEDTVSPRRNASPSSESRWLTREQFRLFLKSLDVENREPLPVHFAWAWQQMSKDQEGERVSAYDLGVMRQQYRQRVNSTPDIFELIKKHKGGGIDEMMSLMKVRHVVLSLATARSNPERRSPI